MLLANLIADILHFDAEARGPVAAHAGCLESEGVSYAVVVAIAGVEEARVGLTEAEEARTGLIRGALIESEGSEADGDVGKRRLAM